ncbi:MAG: phytanoyl-CoA dioxygenase family protein [Ilumatobacteraceae bacterium]
MLSDEEVLRFVVDGYLRLDNAFDDQLAAACVAELWSSLDADPQDTSTWTAPVVRIAGSSSPVLLEAINTPRLVSAIDDVVGIGQWQARTFGYGTFPVRFPSNTDPGDTGWHIDGSFGEPPWYRVNFESRGRALLLLMLFTDVGLDDAPTRIKAGSHLDVARALAGITPEGAPFDVTTQAPQALTRPTVHATGSAGDVYLCHPFLVHAATWPHTGTAPRFIGQPCIHHPEGEWLGGYDYTDFSAASPTKDAVRLALAQTFEERRVQLAWQ